MKIKCDILSCFTSLYRWKTFFLFLATLSGGLTASILNSYFQNDILPNLKTSFSLIGFILLSFSSMSVLSVSSEANINKVIAAKRRKSVSYFYILFILGALTVIIALGFIN